jgi:hypothetical protein
MVQMGSAAILRLNRLHLPMYTDDEICDQKLLYAIQFCQTMENK